MIEFSVGTTIHDGCVCIVFSGQVIWWCDSVYLGVLGYQYLQNECMVGEMWQTNIWNVLFFQLSCR